MRYSILTLSTVVITVLSFVTASPVTKESLAKRANTGRATWFNTGLGACGHANQNSDHVVAISSQRFGSGGNCFQWIKITETQTGTSAFGQTVDSCPGCGEGDLDLSPSLFEQFAPLSQGVFSISWDFEPLGFTPP